MYPGKHRIKDSLLHVEGNMCKKKQLSKLYTWRVPADLAVWEISQSLLFLYLFNVVDVCTALNVSINLNNGSHAETLDRVLYWIKIYLWNHWMVAQVTIKLVTVLVSLCLLVSFSQLPTLTGWMLKVSIWLAMDIHDSFVVHICVCLRTIYCLKNILLKILWFV